MSYLLCYPLEYRHPIKFSQYHFQWLNQPYVRTSFHILLPHTSCIMSNVCSNIPYHVFSCILSMLTYHNHSLCAEHSPHVFHIIYIYLRHPYNKFFQPSWCLRLSSVVLTTSFLFPVSNFHF